MGDVTDMVVQPVCYTTYTQNHIRNLEASTRAKITLLVTALLLHSSTYTLPSNQCQLQTVARALFQQKQKTTLSLDKIKCIGKTKSDSKPE